MDLNNETSNEVDILSTEQTAIAPGEVIIGDLISFDEQGKPLVNFNSSGVQPVAALSTIALTHEHKGRQVALLFADGDLTKPVIMGVIHSPLFDILNQIEIVDSHCVDDSQHKPESLNSAEAQNKGASQSRHQTVANEEEPFEGLGDMQVNESKTQAKSQQQLIDENIAYIDGQKVVLEGHEEIELKCGEASIRLTKAGKILIRGKYLLNRSSGVNRILGGSVQVN